MLKVMDIVVRTFVILAFYITLPIIGLNELKKEKEWNRKK